MQNLLSSARLAVSLTASQSATTRITSTQSIASWLPNFYNLPQKRVTSPMLFFSCPIATEAKVLPADNLATWKRNEPVRFTLHFIIKIII